MIARCGRWVAPLAVAALALCLAAGACGDGDAERPAPTARGTEQAPRQATPAHPADEPAARRAKARPRPTVALARCPAGVPGCRTARGEIVYVERHDPDGDGDAHFVIEDEQGITLPGLTVIDVRRELRPRPLPGPGEVISAAGPVQTGSYGQSQIHALEVRVAGRPRP